MTASNALGRLATIGRFAFAALAAASLAACGINSVPTAQENAKAKNK